MVVRQDNGVYAQVGVSLTHTGMRTGEVAEAFIIMLRTLAPAITHVGRVQTDSGVTTAVKTRARGILALIFILMTMAVIQAVTAQINWKAEAITWQVETWLQYTSVGTQ